MRETAVAVQALEHVWMDVSYLGTISRVIRMLRSFSRTFRFQVDFSSRKIRRRASRIILALFLFLLCSVIFIIIDIIHNIHVCKLFATIVYTRDSLFWPVSCADQANESPPLKNIAKFSLEE